MRRTIRVLLGAGALLAIALITGSAPAHSGFSLQVPPTTAAPVLDGTLGAGEWDDASTFTFAGGAAEGQVWAAHDDEFVYFAFRRVDATPGAEAAFQVYFDDDHSGALDVGEDALSVSVVPDGGSVNTNDSYWNGETWPSDLSGEGAHDIQGGGTYVDETDEVVLELRHPICSADTSHDICLAVDETTAGVTFLYFDVGGSHVSFPGAHDSPSQYGDLSLVAADTTPPETTITSGPSDYGPSTQAIFLTSSSETGSSFECRVVPAAFSECAPSHQLDGLTSGSRTFEIRAIDGAENADPTPAVHRWTVDTVASDGELDQHNGRVTSTSGGRTLGGADNSRLAQIFTPAVAGGIAEVRVGVSCTATQLLQASIFPTAAGGAPDVEDIVASAVASVSPTTTFTRFQFDAAPQIVAGTEYAIVLTAPTDANCFAFMAEDAYPGRVFFDDDTANTPSGWTENQAPEDVGFATFMAEAAAPSLVVTNTNDSGAGSLRQAILDANGSPGLDTISFAIGSGLQTIAPTSPLPVVTDPVVIDGTTQPGYAGTPVIEITGTQVAAPTGDYGLDVTAGGSTIRGLTINGWGAGNLRLRGAGANRVEANYIGTDSTGSHRVSATSAGIWIHSPDNVIGGDTGPVRNVIAGNGVSGEIQVRSRDASGAVIGDATGNVIAGNYIGTNAFGTAALVPPTEAAERILITGAASDTVVGGDTEAERNVIAGGFMGVRIHGATQNEVRGNYIGTDVSGAAAVPNGIGVSLELLAYANETTSSSDDNVVLDNVIAFNGGVGVRVDEGARNRIQENSIHTNGALGIDLGTAGVTPNDGEDTDVGPNGLQNFPELTSVEFAAGSTDRLDISASLSVGGGGDYRIDYYANFVCDPSGNGEGARHLGFGVAAAVGPNVTFASTAVGPVESRELITATVTHPDGSTSEFSECVSIGTAPGELAFTTPSECVPDFLGGQTIDFEGPTTGAVLAEQYAELGLHFVNGTDQTPRALISTERQTSSPPTTLINDADDIEGEITSDDVPLQMSFDQPQTAVGFFLGNGASGVLATVTARQGGAPVGSVTISVPNDGVTSFIGIRLPEGQGTFDGLSLDYGGSPREEEIDDLCFTTSEEAGEESGAITLTSDEKFVPAGVRLVPLASVPSNQLPSFAGSPSSAPVGSIPVGSIPVGSIPVGSIPVGSIPVGSIPVGSIPVGSIPVGSIPVGSIGLTGVPVGSIGLDQILLSMLPVNADELLAGTPLATRPRQTVTLADVYANLTTRTRFNALKLPESGLMSSILNGVPFSAFLLGSAQLSQLPPPGSSTWCGAITAAGGSCTGVSGTNTVVGLSIAGVPVGSIPVGSIPVGSIPVGSIPVGSIPVGSIDLEASRLAGIPVGSIPAANRDEVVDSPFPADWTLRDAKAAGRIKPGAQLRHLVGAFPNGLVLNDLILGILPRSALAWEAFPLDGFQLFAGTGDTVQYRLRFTMPCPVPSDLAVRVRLPEGWLYKPGTTRWQYGTSATPVAGTEPSTTSRAGARWATLPGTPCPQGSSAREVELSFQALSGLTLGSGEAEGFVTMAGVTHEATSNASVLVTQNWEDNDTAESAQLIQKDQLVVGHVASAGDTEVFRIPIPARGTRTRFHLSHIAEGADFDLVVGKPAAESLQSNPVGSIPVGSIVVEDGGSSVDNSDESLPPETLQDIPVGSIPVGSISATRGDADEVAQVVADGEQGFYTIIVSGYNGSHSDQPFVLRVSQTPPVTLPPCPARSLSLGAAGTLPPAVSGAETLFVVNRQRLAALYPGQDLTAMYQALNDVAAEVNGQVLEVDGSADVQAKYAAWDQSPCSIDAANDVVRAINTAIAPYRAAAKYVVLLGTDEALPMMRRLDPVTISNETDEAPDLAFTLSGGNANALYAAAARGYFLSDTVYGAFTSVPWLGRDLYLPNIPVGRLVETPNDIRAQLELYLDAPGGALDPRSSVTTAYDFLTDGGQAVAGGVAGLAGPHESIINDTWTATTLAPKLTSPADVLSLNAHYSHWLLQPAAGTALVSTANLPTVEGAFANRILFTMGCHGGLNVADTLVPNPSTAQQARLRDWTQAFAQRRAAVYVANTGFGYGDTEANALSERLMSLFASKLPQKGTIGERWLDAVHEYFGTAGVYGVYDEKALTEATFYGLPFWSLGPASVPTPPSIGPVSPGPISGVSVADLTVTPSLAERPTPRGRFWEANPGKQTLGIHYRPIQPRVPIDVTQPGLVATGAMITSLTTNDVAGVDPVNATPTIDLSANEPERRFHEQIFPANVVALTRSRGPAGDRQRAVVIAGQFRPPLNASDTPTERLVGQISLEIAYVPSPTDTTPPAIEQVAAVRSATSNTIFVRASESAAGGVQRVRALYAPAGGGSPLVWTSIPLTDPDSDGLWSGTVTNVSTQLQVIAMAQNANGLVGYSANKGENHPSVTDANGPDVVLEAPAPGAEYFLNQQVPISFACSDAGIVASCSGAPTLPGNLLDTQTVGLKTFTVTATDTTGNTTTEVIEYRVVFRFGGFVQPISAPPFLNQVRAGRAVPIRFSLGGNQGLNIFAAGYPSSRQIACDTSAPLDSDVQTSSAGASSLVYEAGSDRYLYTWKTESSWANTCRRLLFKFVDGKERHLDFKFTR